jgi:1-aminocyclopropane-1-carboxylate deaminase/D-cysteine desulfhydrase-like pyridoxal-dependent ACC family enzyme
MSPSESLCIDPMLAGTDPLELSEFTRQKIRAYTLRLDKIHPVVSGNKWFKLKEHLRIAAEKKSQGIVTFGGPWSNHIVATAYAAQISGLKATGIIRGEKPQTLSATLRDAAGYGMRLEFIPRTAYKKRDDPGFLSEVAATHPGDYILPEGAGGQAGITGSEEIGRWAEKDRYSHILCAIGTGTMFMGLVRASAPPQKIIGIPVLKGLYDFLPAAAKWIDDPGSMTRCEIIDHYHFGGYAHKTEELLRFMHGLHADTGIPTDFVYTGKLFYAAMDLASKGFFPPGSEILIIHSGGLQGNRSLPPGTLGF